MEPVNIARAWVEAANRLDAERLEELSSPDIEIVGPRGAVRGHQILREWLQRAGLTLETKRVFARGRVVVLQQRGVWRSLETGETVGEADVASCFQIEGGRVVGYERFDDLESALLAAGLQESEDR